MKSQIIEDNQYFMGIKLFHKLSIFLSVNFQSSFTVLSIAVSVCHGSCCDTEIKWFQCIWIKYLCKVHVYQWQYTDALWFTLSERVSVMQDICKELFKLLVNWNRQVNEFGLSGNIKNWLCLHNAYMEFELTVLLTAY